MVTKIHRDALVGEIESVRALIERQMDADPLGSLSLRKRLRKLEEELHDVDREPRTHAKVALVFDGDPVRGSRAIEADFAGKALQDYQELLVKLVASDGGPLAIRGRLPDAAHSQAKMTVTGLVHGSFGFVLQEDDTDQIGMFDSPVRQAVVAATDLLKEISAEEVQAFEARLNEMDIRVFNSVKRFVQTIHKAKSTVRFAEQDREFSLDAVSLDRAFDRLTNSEVEELDETFEGDLLGLVPLRRIFEFRVWESGEVIDGRVAQNLSADYLERLEQEGLVAAGGWQATVRTKTVRHPDGRHTAISRLLTDLIRLKA